jgi:hypothetical protein
MTDQVTSPGPVLDNARGAPAKSVGLVENPSSSQRSLRLERLIQFVLRPPFILFVVVTLLVSRGITQGEFFYYGDEMRHAMNGVFFRDFISDLPLDHPLQYTYEYYAKYPALAFPHWPPLFYFIEGVFFLLFGLSPWVSRVAILCFALLAVQFWYLIAERLGPRYRAFLSAVILASTPFILFYERVTMLEIPALAVCLGVIYFWLKFLESERRRDLWVLSSFVVVAFLISQKAIFLVFFIGFDFVMERRFRLLKRLDIWLALLASVLAVLPWYWLASKTMSTWLTRVIGHGYSYLLPSSNYTFYLAKLYSQLGPVLLSLACVGFVLALLRRTRADRILLVWVLSGYICFALISEKDPRHTMLWIPPLLYLALMALETLLIRRDLGLIATSALALVFLVSGLRSIGPKLTGVQEAAQYVLSLPESDIVYYQGDLDGDFIFFVRKFDPEKRHMVAREKQVVVSRLGGRPREVLHTEEEVLNFFRTWGIRYAVVTDVDELPGLAPVRELLNSDQFELLRSFPVHTSQSNVLVHQIQVFRYRGELHRTQEIVTIPMMTIRQNIPADLTRLAGRPWPN